MIGRRNKNKPGKGYKASTVNSVAQDTADFKFVKLVA